VTGSAVLSFAVPSLTQGNGAVANAGLVVLTPNPKTKLEVPINAIPRLYDCLINADDLELEELAKIG
jgi:hypothetical protein